jgi:hypothetical protein
MSESKTKSSDLYRDRIHVARTFTEKNWHHKIPEWNRLWAGTEKPDNVDEANRIFVGYTYATLKNKVARLYYRNPKIVVRPRKPDAPGAIENAKNAEKTVNYQATLPEVPLRQQIVQTLYDLKRTGIGIIFTGWRTLLDRDEEGNPTKLRNDQPVIQRMHPKRVFFPPDFTREHCPYIVLEFPKSVKAVKENPQYNAKARDEVSAKHYVDETYRESIGSAQYKVGETEDMGRVREFHYFDNEKWVIFAEGVEIPLLERDNPYASVFGADSPLPVTFVFGDEVLDSPWPISEVELLKPQQRELNKIRAQQVNHRKRFNRKYLFDKTKWDQAAVDKFKEPADGTMVGIDTDGQPLMNSLFPVPETPLQYPFNVEEAIKQDIHVVSGVTALGFTSQSRNKTLGQDDLAEQRSKDRMDDEQAQVEEFVENVYTRLLQLDQAFLDKELAVQISNLPGDRQWLRVTKDQIAGEFDLKVVSGSTVRETDDEVRKQAIQILDVVSKTPSLTPIAGEIVVKLMDTFPFLQDITEKAKLLLAAPPMLPPGMPGADGLPPDAATVPGPGLPDAGPPPIMPPAGV